MKTIVSDRDPIRSTYITMPDPDSKYSSCPDADPELP
jgi:hypothetical protein